MANLELDGGVCGRRKSFAGGLLEWESFGFCLGTGDLKLLDFFKKLLGVSIAIPVKSG